MFQPTLPHGERHAFGVEWLTQFDVSTHAPAWGATVIETEGDELIAVFQPTLPHGERLRTQRKQRLTLWFQPTLPHGERRRLVPQGLLRNGFNPRSRMGSDPFVASYDGVTWKFQPTLPHGERLNLTCSDEHLGRVSTHAPAWGATLHCRQCL